MAEFCLDCWNKLNATAHSPRRYILSQELDFCEECQTFQHVIVAERMWSRIQRTLAEVKASRQRKVKG